MKYTDLVLEVGNSTFHCHKFMLARKSDVFDAMFSHDFSEKHNNKVVIEDLEAEAVLEMLRFIYLGKVLQMERVNKSVLFAADKYNIVDLKGIFDRLPIILILYLNYIFFQIVIS